MNLTFLALKRDLPELNVLEIYPPRILSVFEKKRIFFREVTMDDAGCYIYQNGKDYVFLRSAMAQLLYHETLCYESVHALAHHPAPFLLWRHNLEAAAMSLIGMMPITKLKELNRRKHELDDEHYRLLMDRNLVKERWKL